MDCTSPMDQELKVTEEEEAKALLQSCKTEAHSSSSSPAPPQPVEGLLEVGPPSIFDQDL